MSREADLPQKVMSQSHVQDPHSRLAERLHGVLVQIGNCNPCGKLQVGRNSKKCLVVVVLVRQLGVQHKHRLGFTC